MEPTTYLVSYVYPAEYMLAELSGLNLVTAGGRVPGPPVGRITVAVKYEPALQ